MRTTHYAVALGVIVTGLTIYALRDLVRHAPPAVGLLAGLAGCITFMVADVKLLRLSYWWRNRTRGRF